MMFGFARHRIRWGRGLIAAAIVGGVVILAVLLVVNVAGLDCNSTGSLHRVPCVDHQVHDDLPQFALVELHRSHRRLFSRLHLHFQQTF